ncbi:hypothetical protein GA752_05040 [Bifidobacterium adolescentis]|uniref:Uncharacterized protein n=1 Tax=Bifidobacterium adolescentis TaxID=1680 RepID=A0A7J5MYS9_BIFAD|nr:hypothetical protein GA752_05040 [Bifidobacterium adolescentis]
MVAVATDAVVTVPSGLVSSIWAAVWLDPSGWFGVHAMSSVSGVARVAPCVGAVMVGVSGGQMVVIWLDCVHFPVRMPLAASLP